MSNLINFLERRKSPLNDLESIEASLGIKLPKEITKIFNNMVFNTKDVLFTFDNIKIEVSFLIHRRKEIEAREYGSFDPALGICYDIIEILLSLNELKTIEFINSIEDEYDMVSLSSMFGRISFRFQSPEFISFIETILLKFQDSQYYDSIKYDVDEAKKTLID